VTAPRFLLIETVLALHAEQIGVFGGMHGTRDRGLLESALAQPEATFEGEYLHLSLHEMAAAYLYHVVRNHPFLDGNKRTGYVAALVFLAVNGAPTDDEFEELYDVTASTTCPPIWARPRSSSATSSRPRPRSPSPRTASRPSHSRHCAPEPPGAEIGPGGSGPVAVSLPQLSRSGIGAGAATAPGSRSGSRGEREPERQREPEPHREREPHLQERHRKGPHWAFGYSVARTFGAGTPRRPKIGSTSRRFDLRIRK
jgi:death-on-curing protein